MNILTKLRYVPKKVALIAATFVAGTYAAATFAWGPDRPTFTIEQPASYVTFNSITNNPNYGDERNFVIAKDAASTNPGDWRDELTVEPGKEYVVRLYVHNNAADNLNLTATNTKAMVNIPTTTGTSVQIDGFVSADNAKPAKVWDQVILKSNQQFNLRYVAGSAEYSTNANPSGFKLGDSLVTSAGALLGYDKLDGNVPGCFKYSGVLTFKVKPQFAEKTDFTLVKDVRKAGGTYGQTASVNPGDKVDYRIAFKNTGSTTLENVVIKDQLPAGLKYVAGSAQMQNINYQYPNTLKLDEKLFSTGSNIGSYTKDANAFVTFSAEVVDNASLPACGVNTLKNIAKVETDTEYVTDDADVTVTKTCDTPKPVANYSCDALTVNKIERTKFSFDTKYTAENVDFVRIDYVIRDAAGKEIYRGTNRDYTQTAPGSYTVEAHVVVKVDGTEKSATSDNCKKPFTVEPAPVTPPVEIKVCDLKSGTIVTIKESEFDNKKYSKNLDDCKNINVCRLSDKQVATIKETAFDSTKYSRSTDDCKPPVSTTPTPPKPAAPATIASTGPEMIVGGLFGSSALGLGISSYVRSRSALKSAMLKK